VRVTIVTRAHLLSEHVEFEPALEDRDDALAAVLLLGLVGAAGVADVHLQARGQGVSEPARRARVDPVGLRPTSACAHSASSGDAPPSGCSG